MFDHVVANDVWVYRGILNSTLLHCLKSSTKKDELTMLDFMSSNDLLVWICCGTLLSYFLS